MPIAINSRKRIPCPPYNVWAEVAAGLPKPAEAEALLAHAANCEACAASLHEAIMIVNGAPIPEEFLAELQMASATGVAELGHQMASRHAKPLWRGNSLLKVAAGLAVIVGGAAFFGWWQSNRGGEPLTLLAKAYETRRTIEVRVPGAGHGPMRVERGGGAESPVEMLEAQVMIRRRLDRNPDDASALHAKGRSELLSWRFNDAMQSFQAAADLGADSAEFLVDFATAYFERAEQNKEPVDYTQSVELLSKALKKSPGYDVALYNRAIVYGKLMLLIPAIEDFEQFLRVEKDPGWRGEAEKRLAEVRRLKRD